MGRRISSSGLGRSYRWLTMTVRHSTAVPTIKVVSSWTADGFVLINEADYDPAMHMLHAEDAISAVLEVARKRGRPRVNRDMD